MDREELFGVRCILNTDNLSIVEIRTNKDEYIIKLPYTTITTQKGINYNYSISVKDYCKLHNIEYKKYFNMLHRDCN